MKQLPTLCAGPVRLRQLALADLDDLHAVFSDPRSMRYWSRPAFAHLDETRDYLAAIDTDRNSGELLQWGVEALDSQRVIGTTTLFNIDRNQGRAEIGYILGSAHWGRGYASAALRSLFAYAQDHFGLRRIEADIDPRNSASLRLCERLGFVREGYARERWIVAGEVQDAVLLGLLLRELPKP